MKVLQDFALWEVKKRKSAGLLYTELLIQGTHNLIYISSQGFLQLYIYLYGIGLSKI